MTAPSLRPAGRPVTTPPEVERYIVEQRDRFGLSWLQIAKALNRLEVPLPAHGRTWHPASTHSIYQRIKADPRERGRAAAIRYARLFVDDPDPVLAQRARDWLESITTRGERP